MEKIVEVPQVQIVDKIVPPAHASGGKSLGDVTLQKGKERHHGTEVRP